MPATGMLSSFAMAIVSWLWSPWPWVSRMWVAPAMASSRRASSKQRVAEPGVEEQHLVLDLDAKAAVAQPCHSHGVRSSPWFYMCPASGLRLGECQWTCFGRQQLLRADGRELLVRASQCGDECGVPRRGLAGVADGGAGGGPGGAGPGGDRGCDRGGVLPLPHPCPGLGAAGGRDPDPDLHPRLSRRGHGALLRRAVVGRRGGGGRLRPGERAGGARDRGGGGAAQRLDGLHAGADPDRALCRGASQARAGDRVRDGGRARACWRCRSSSGRSTRRSARAFRWARISSGTSSMRRCSGG